MAQIPERVEPQRPTKGVSVYSIVSAQAGGISDALLRATAGGKLDDWKKKVDDALVWNIKELEKIPKRDLEGAMGIVYTSLIDGTKLLIDAWKAGLGLQMGTAFMGLEETHMGFPQLLSMYKIEQLEALVRPRLARYWQSKYTPNVPNPLMAFRMVMEGDISRKEFNEYCLEDGWDKAWHDKLYNIFDRDPNEVMAFSMFKRQLITEDEMKRCFSIRGYDASWHTALYQALHRRPTFRELTSLSDFVVLPDLWVREVLRAGGYTDGDINYIASAIAKRPLREEVRSVVGRYLWERQIGRIDKDTLTAQLKKLGLLPLEIELNVLWGELRYQDELIDEKLAVLEERCKQGDITDEQDALDLVLELGILEEKANLIANLWRWKYNLTPIPP